MTVSTTATTTIALRDKKGLFCHEQNINHFSCTGCNEAAGVCNQSIPCLNSGSYCVPFWIEDVVVFQPFLFIILKPSPLALVVQTLNSTIRWINHYPADKHQGKHWMKIYSVDNIVCLLNNWALGDKQPMLMALNFLKLCMCCSVSFFFLIFALLFLFCSQQLIIKECWYDITLLKM